VPSDSRTGLTSAEVAERVRRGESNDYKARVGRSYWEIVRDNLLNLFNIILFTLLIIVALFRDYTTVFFAGFSVVTNSFLGMIQEISAKRKLDKLAALAAQDVLVWRDGKLVKVPIAQIVKDDVMPIEPGDRLVVDGHVLESDALEMDESHLTGESDAVLKDVDDKLYSGSYCIAGSGLMVATAVGKDSTISRLSTAAKAYKNVQTPTQQKITALVEISVLAMAIFGPMLFIAGIVNSLEFVEIIRNTIVFVTSLVPQGLVLVAILSLTLGAIRISRHQTLIQRVNAVESMANVTVLCFDKTGTLTRNELAVTEILPLNGDTPAQIEGRLQTYLSNVSHMNRTAAAVAAYVNQPGKEPDAQNGVAKVSEVPFNSARKWGAVTFDNNDTLLLGAPERLLPTGNSHAKQAEALAAGGLRVIAFVRTPTPPKDGHIASNVEPIALIVMSDQVRTDIHETLRAFQDQNVTLKVISGDNLETVKAIATQSGLKIRRSYTGDQLEAMSEIELEAAVAEGDLFARIEPETKRKLVGTLKRLGQYVAMVGDGVNDVPALKEAHLAIAMNDGAQIAKDVADIVLLNNAMSTLPLAFKEGKSITQIIYGTTKLFLAKNFYNILLFIFVGFMMLPFPISPTQISWITFGTVNIPATLIAFEILRPAHMQRFRRDVFDYVMISGLIGGVVMALLYAVAYFSGDLNSARSAITVFIALYGTLIFWNVHGVDLLQPRTLFLHGRVTVLGIGLAAFTMAGPYLYPDPDLFRFVSPTPQLWALIVALFLIATLVVGIVMRHRRLVNQLWLLFAP
jgi:cation-transporting P-type ATPase E